MKKIIQTVALLLLPFGIAFGQERIAISSGQNIVMSGGTSANPIYLMPGDGTPNGISSSGGNIISESEYNMVLWNIGTNTGTYTVPFGYSSTVSLPVTLNISSAGTGSGVVKFSTYHTAALNSGANPSDVTNETPFFLPGSPSNSDNSYNMADRFYIIDANTGYSVKPTLGNVTFSYISGTANTEVGGANTLTESRLMAQRYNSTTNTWNDWYGYGCSDAVASNIGTVSTGPVSSTNFFRSWSLWDNTMSLPLTIAGTNASLGCSGNGTATVTIYGGKVPYTYTWSNGGTTSSIGSLSGGTYTLTATDAGGCNSTASITITQPAAVSVIASVTNYITCFGGSNGSAVASPSGGTQPYTYLWSDATSATTASVSNLSAGSYTVNVSDAGGACGASSSVTITQPTQFQYTTAGTISEVSCNGGNNGHVTANPVGGNLPYTYAWSNGTSTVATTQAPNTMSAGLYTVTVMDNCGVTKTASAVVTQPNDMRDSVVTQTNITCGGGNGGSITIGTKGGTYPFNYLWSNSTTLAAVSGLTAGMYSIVITDHNGCTNTVSGISITQPTPIRDSVVSISYPMCYGESGSATVGIQGGTAPYLYSWSPNVSTTNMASNVSAATYTVTMKDAHRCSVQLVIAMTQPLAIRDSMIASQTTNIICKNGSTGSLTVGVKYGTPPYNYNWSPNVSSTATASGLSAGTYSVSITDAIGCSGGIATATITQPANYLHDSVAWQTNVGCYGGSGGQVSLGSRGGIAPYTYAWNNGKTTTLITGLTAGTYSVVMTDQLGCTLNTTGITISQPTQVSSVIPAPTCGPAGHGTITISASGGTPGYVYTWSNGSLQQACW